MNQSLRRIAASALALLAVAAASAQAPDAQTAPPPATGAATAPTVFDRGAVEKSVVGHKLTMLRHADNQRVVWAVDRNGVLYGENLSQGTKDTARWTVDDSGALCVKWKGNSRDGCRTFAVVDGSMRMVDPTAPGVVFATVEKVD